MIEPTIPRTSDPTLEAPMRKTSVRSRCSVAIESDVAGSTLPRMGRIVVFGPFPPPYGGNAKHTADVARSLEEAGVTVERKRFTMDFEPGSPHVQRSVKSVVRNFASV